MADRAPVRIFKPSALPTVRPASAQGPTTLRPLVQNEQGFTPTQATPLVAPTKPIINPAGPVTLVPKYPHLKPVSAADVAGQQMTGQGPGGRANAAFGEALANSTTKTAMIVNSVLTSLGPKPPTSVGAIVNDLLLVAPGPIKGLDAIITAVKEARNVDEAMGILTRIHEAYKAPGPIARAVGKTRFGTPKTFTDLPAGEHIATPGDAVKWLAHGGDIAAVPKDILDQLPPSVLHDLGHAHPTHPSDTVAGATVAPGDVAAPAETTPAPTAVPQTPHVAPPAADSTPGGTTFPADWTTPEKPLYVPQEWKPINEAASVRSSLHEPTQFGQTATTAAVDKIARLHPELAPQVNRIQTALAKDDLVGAHQNIVSLLGHGSLTRDTAAAVVDAAHSVEQHAIETNAPTSFWERLKGESGQLNPGTPRGGFKIKPIPDQLYNTPEMKAALDPANNGAWHHKLETDTAPKMTAARSKEIAKSILAAGHKMPPNMDTPAKLAREVRSLHDVITQGSAYRQWYKEASDNVHRISADTGAPPEVVSSLLAVYSANADPTNNALIAMRALHEFNATGTIEHTNGMGEGTGKYQRGKALQILNDWKNGHVGSAYPWEGRKTTGYNAAMEGAHGAPSAEHPAVIDARMAEGMIGEEKVPDKYYSAMEAVVQHLAAERNWDTGEAQAAAWVIFKAENIIRNAIARGRKPPELHDAIVAASDAYHNAIERYTGSKATHVDKLLSHLPDDSKVKAAISRIIHEERGSFGRGEPLDARDASKMQIANEVKPGPHVGTPEDHAFWNGLTDAQKAEYSDKVFQLTRDGKLEKAVGLESAGHHMGIGVWRGETTLGTANHVHVGDLTPEVRSKLDAVASAKGMIQGQDSVSWGRPLKAGTTGENIYPGFLVSPGEHTAKDIAALGDAVDKEFGAGWVGVIHGPNDSYYLVDFSESPNFAERLHGLLQGQRLEPIAWQGHYVEDQAAREAGAFGTSYQDALAAHPELQQIVDKAQGQVQKIRSQIKGGSAQAEHDALVAQHNKGLDAIADAHLGTPPRNAEANRARTRNAITRVNNGSKGGAGRRAYKAVPKTVKEERRAYAQKIIDAHIEANPEHPISQAWTQREDRIHELEQQLSPNPDTIFGKLKDETGSLNLRALVRKTTRTPEQAQAHIKESIQKALNEGFGEHTPASPSNVPTVPKGTPPPEELGGDLGAKVRKALQGGPTEGVQGSVRGARSVRKEQDVLTAEARSERAKAAEKHLQAGNFEAAMKELRGAMPRVEFEGFKQFDEATVKAMESHVMEHPYLRPYEKINTIQALRDAHRGKVPTRSQQRLLERVFGKNISDQVTQGASEIHKWGKRLMNLLNVPRSIMASMDLSAPFRQGLVVATSHPIIFAKAFGPMLRAARHEHNFQHLIQDEIHARPTYPLMEKAKVSFTDIGGDAHGTEALSNREEQFMSNYAERIPGLGRLVRGSDRAYVGFLNKIRADVFDHLVQQAAAQGHDVSNTKFLESLGKFVNSATGRGDLGKLNDHTATLNALFFAPRLLASRVNFLNPLYYAKLDPFARKQALKAFIGLGATASTILQIAHMGGAQVNLDPTNADFAKIREGNARVDLLGGFQQPIRLAAQLAEGKLTSSTTGQAFPLGSGFGKTSRFDVLMKFLQGKLSPIPSLTVDALKGKDYTGNVVAWDNLSSIEKEIATRMTPFLAQDLYDIQNTSNNPAATAGLGALDVIGVGVQDYKGGVPARTVSSAEHKLEKDSAEAQMGKPPPEVVEDLKWYVKLQSAANHATTNGRIDYYKALQAAAQLYDQRYPGDNLSGQVTSVKTQGEAEQYYRTISSHLYPSYDRWHSIEERRLNLLHAQQGVK